MMTAQQHKTELENNLDGRKEGLEETRPLLVPPMRTNEPCLASKQSCGREDPLSEKNGTSNYLPQAMLSCTTLRSLVQEIGIYVSYLERHTPQASHQGRLETASIIVSSVRSHGPSTSAVSCFHRWLLANSVSRNSLQQAFSSCACARGKSCVCVVQRPSHDSAVKQVISLLDTSNVCRGLFICATHFFHIARLTPSSGQLLDLVPIYHHVMRDT